MGQVKVRFTPKGCVLRKGAGAGAEILLYY